MPMRSNSSRRLKNAQFILAFVPVALLLAVTTARGEGAAIPWLNQTAEPPALPMAAAQAQRPCAADDLQLTLGQQGAHHGFATQEVRITNRSSEQCSLTGFPSTKIEHDAETPQTLSAHADLPQLASERINLEPGEDVVMLVGAPGACDASAGEKRKVATRMRVALPGGAPTVLDGAHIDTLCGSASVVRFASARNGAAPGLRVAVTGGPQTGELTGGVSLPETVRRGETLRYTVILSNPTGEATSLSSCPTYTQSLYADGKTASSTMRLNCGGAGGRIAAHSSAAFKMELPVPAGMAAGEAKLSWVLQNGPGVGAIVILK